MCVCVCVWEREDGRRMKGIGEGQEERWMHATLVYIKVNLVTCTERHESLYMK